MKNTMGIIPDLMAPEEYLRLAEEKGLFFEYNDFFHPEILDDKTRLRDLVKRAAGLGRGKAMDTLHGVFLDINPASGDPAIKRVVLDRMRSSMEIGQELGVRLVVYHTNYITNFLNSYYREDWLDQCEEAYRGLLREYPAGPMICLENMFDPDPVLLGRLAERLSDEERFAVCLDYAHARVFGKEPEPFIRNLAVHVRHMHINDNWGMEDDHLALGEGSIDWQAFRTQMEAFGLDRADISVLIEHRGIDQIRRSLDYLERL